MFRLTHKALGKMWSISLQLKQDHKLITTGVYRWLRHPMYTAFWLMAVAQALLLPNWVAGLSGIVGFGTLFFLRIGPEEAMMEQAFGDEYRAYKARTKRVIPLVY
jgi:protein-S-isoprenylcysteine O-methyltransferase Ste14